ncbi:MULTISPECIES: DUF1223 domain-containing protein [Sphingomonas]|uniref:DUF1223 domain-containing protein n=1 Tax=Sphingomonas TaxID=13687 RepID=UPI001F081B89|nr:MULTISPECIES: DUF1223 domain-containing protein [Sphingomonas]
MRRAALLIAALLTGCSSSSGQPMRDAPAKPASPPIAGDARHPRVIELFQSQGCSSCPPANANLNRIADRPDVLALSFAVTYWDQLGWKDRFASPAFTRRQWDYAHAGGRNQVATPQMIWNGRQAIVGGNPRQVDQLLRTTPPLTAGPAIDAAPGAINIGPGKPTQPATVWLVRYDPRVRQVAITAGENGGRTLPHRNIVTELSDRGRWTGAPLRLAVTPPADPAWKTAVLLQQGPGGPLLAARRF